VEDLGTFGIQDPSSHLSALAGGRGFLARKKERDEKGEKTNFVCGGGVAGFLLPGTLF